MRAVDPEKPIFITEFDNGYNANEWKTIQGNLE